MIPIIVQSKSPHTSSQCLFIKRHHDIVDSPMDQKIPVDLQHVNQEIKVLTFREPKWLCEIKVCFLDPYSSHESRAQIGIVTVLILIGILIYNTTSVNTFQKKIEKKYIYICHRRDSNSRRQGPTLISKVALT